MTWLTLRLESAVHTPGAEQFEKGTLNFPAASAASLEIVLGGITLKVAFCKNPEVSRFAIFTPYVWY